MQMQIGKNHVLFDAEDAGKILSRKWKIRDGYAYSGFVAMHRLIISAPLGAVVDHISGDKLDNRKSNLRICAALDNARNRAKKSTTSNRFKGITVYYEAGWLAQISISGVTISLGVFETDEDAARAYDSAASHIYGDFARLNFPNEKPIPFRLQSLTGLNRERMANVLRKIKHNPVSLIVERDMETAK